MITCLGFRVENQGKELGVRVIWEQDGNNIGVGQTKIRHLNSTEKKSLNRSLVDKCLISVIFHIKI